MPALLLGLATVARASPFMLPRRLPLVPGYVPYTSDTDETSRGLSPVFVGVPFASARWRLLFLSSPPTFAE